MAETVKHIVKFWRGNRATYNKIQTKDYWTRYSIIESDGTVTETFGDSRIVSEPTGQLQPVVDVVESLLAIESPIHGERYLVGHPADENHENASYDIYTLSVDNGIIKEDECKVDPFTRNMSVRIVNRYMKCYQLVEGQLITYDDVDCGTF